jgi:carboxyl-terminal processing protease
MAEGLTTDYAALSWTEAFESLHTRLSTEYAFTQWKGIDWEALGASCREQAAKAQTENNFDAYYIALRKYITAIPDGHVRITNLPQTDVKYIGGGFGIAPALLEGGTVIACWVDEKSEAYRMGMRAGDELIAWNGRPIAEAAKTARTEFTYNSATEENAAQKRVQYLARAPVGTAAEVTCRHSDADETFTVTLTAQADGMITLEKNYPDAVVSDQIRNLILGVENKGPTLAYMVTSQMLDGNIAYIKLLGEFDADLTGSGSAPSTLGMFRDAVKTAIDADAAGLILDIRNNVGGLDDMAAAILGSFYTQKAFYEDQNTFDPKTGGRTVKAGGTLYIEPAQDLFTGHVIALINQKCLSSGEGIALGIQNLDNGDTLGFYGTNGSFGLTGSEAKLPGGLTVSWPSGQSLGADGQIQLDSRGGIGGVAPTIRVPMTSERAQRVAQGEDIDLEEAIAVLSENR